MEQDGSGVLKRFWLPCCLVLSATVAVLDLTLSLASVPSGTWSPWVCVCSFAATAGLTAALYALFCLGLFIYLRKLLPWNDPRLPVSLAVFLGVVIRLVPLVGLAGLALEIEELFRLTCVGGLALGAAVFFFGAGAGARNPWKILICAMGCLGTADLSLWAWGRALEPGPFMAFLPGRTLLSYLGGLSLAAMAYRFREKRLRLALSMLLLGFFLSGSIVLAYLEKKRMEGHGTPRDVPRVILIVVDTLRADAVSFLNPNTAPTPHMDALARDGMVFRRAVSPAPWTLPAMTSLLTGVSPSVHLATQAASRVPDALPMLGEVFKEAGYYTAAFGYNPVLQGEGSSSKGFEEFHFLRRQSRITRLSLGGRIVERFFPEWTGAGRTSHVLSRGFEEWLEGKEKTDFLVWMHYFDPHGPYGPPDRLIPPGHVPASVGRRFTRIDEIRSGHWVPDLEERKWIRRLYEGEVEYVDEALGVFLGALKDKGLYRDSLIVLTSDHGEEILEHGGCGHGQSLYQEVIHVPLVVKLPAGWGKEPRTVDALVTTEGLFPTLLDLCGIPYAEEAFTGVSLAPQLEGSWEAPTGQLVVSTGLLYFEDQTGVLFDHMKYMRSALEGRERLYDLEDDPFELHSVEEREPQAVLEGRGLLAKHDEKSAQLRDQYGIFSALEGKMDGHRIQQLRELGYLH